MVLFLDNKSAIDLARNPVLYGRCKSKSKHIEARFHNLIEQVNKGVLKVVHSLLK
jgi:hypothetical protein